MSVKHFVDYQNATDIVTEIGNKLKAVNGAYVFKGSIAFASLPAISGVTASDVGNVYNITDDFTTTADFIEGAGKKYSAGTNVAIANVGTTSLPTYKFDVISTFVNVDALNGRIDGVENMITTNVFDNTQAYNAGDIVIHEDGLYRFKTGGHTAGDPWSATEVDAIDIIGLISAAEPDSLDTSEVNALIALLS